MNEVTVYTMAYCPYCVRAKDLLKQRGVSFKEVLVPEDDDAAWTMLEKKSGMKTMPIIFKGEKLIGGYQQLAELDRTAGLDSLKSS